MEEEEKKHEENSKHEEVNENISPPQTIEQTETQIQTSDITTSDIQNMEVHHHPHVEKKNFKEYLLEGLMIFLAVTMGFFAENLREDITESNREKEFARELYTELKDDSTVAANKISIRVNKEKDMDYLTAYFKDSSFTVLPKFFYPAFTRSLYLINTYAFEPKDGILTQLRNSGSILSFKNIELQKLLGDISVSINTIRFRNEQEYQFFASPLKPFLLEHCDFNWLDQVRKNDKDTSVLTVITHYTESSNFYDAKILHVESIDRTEASNMVVFYKQMLVSTRTLQLNNYINLNHEILELLRKNYSLENEQ